MKITFCAAVDERERCCVERDGQRCDRATSWRFSERASDGHGAPDFETEVYVFTCSDCAADARRVLGHAVVAEHVARVG